MKANTAAVTQQVVTHELGRVLSVSKEVMRVRAGAFDYDAKRAASCLLEPIAGDIVVVLHVPNGAAYVSAVLEREEGAPSTWSAEGDLAIRQKNGRISLAAQNGIDLVAATDVSIAGHALKVAATEGTIALQKLGFVGGLVRAQFDRAKVLAESVDSVLDRFSQRVKRSYRTVEETDQVRAERIDYSASSTMSLHGENALVTAEELVKVDGEQIHLG